MDIEGEGRIRSGAVLHDFAELDALGGGTGQGAVVAQIDQLTATAFVSGSSGFRPVAADKAERAGIILSLAHLRLVQVVGLVAGAHRAFGDIEITVRVRRAQGSRPGAEGFQPILHLNGAVYQLVDPALLIAGGAVGNRLDPAAVSIQNIGILGEIVMLVLLAGFKAGVRKGVLRRIVRGIGIFAFGFRIPVVGIEGIGAVLIDRIPLRQDIGNIPGGNIPADAHLIDQPDGIRRPVLQRHFAGIIGMIRVNGDPISNHRQQRRGNPEENGLIAGLNLCEDLDGYVHHIGSVGSLGIGGGTKQKIAFVGIYRTLGRFGIVFRPEPQIFTVGAAVPADVAAPRRLAGVTQLTRVPCPRQQIPDGLRITDA